MGILLFTEEEDNLIRQFYPACKKETLLSKINKSWDQISCRARYLKVKHGGDCVICGKRTTKVADGLFICSDCFYTKGGKCSICGKPIGGRAKYCFSCARKIKPNNEVVCKSCGKKLSHHAKFKYCFVCRRKLKIGKDKCTCLMCGKNFFVSKYKLNTGRGKYCSSACYRKYRAENIHIFARHRFPFLDGTNVIMMRSSWEVATATFLTANKIKFIYEPTAIKTNYGYYTPDFFIPTKNKYIEVKGYISDKAAKKMEAFRLLGNTLIIFDQSVMKRFILPKMI